MERREALKTLGAAGAALALTPSALAARPFEKRVPYTAADFGPDFLWGVATAAYQIEGGHDADGKGPSIWDTFSHRKGKIDRNEHGDVSCDFYHTYKQDLALLKSLNMDVFRFSTAWARVLPNGTGQVNNKGLDFYKRVVDTCLEMGIQPWMTLYHWDLPQALEDRGGWQNRDVTGWFEEYANLITRTFGDRVKNWMVLNEPMAFTAIGYLLGIHAPGKKWPKNFLPTVHHATLCQADGGRIIRANVPGAQVGTTFSCSPSEAVNDHLRHNTVVTRFDVLMNRMYIEPPQGLGYPIDDLPMIKRLPEYIRDGDMERVKFDFDFYGLQNYTRNVARANAIIPYMKGAPVAPRKLVPRPQITDMNWEVHPQGIYKMLHYFAKYPGIKKIIVTENGAAFPDTVTNGRVHDPERTQFYQDYIGEVLRAKREGVNVAGYFAWTFLDNFEWAEGYRTRFGLVHVDFANQQRIVKDSGLWFRDFLADRIN
jgi:beta-glucosidase